MTLRFGNITERGLAAEQVILRRVTYFARNDRINLDSVLSLCTDQVCRFYNQSNFVMLFKIFNRRERLENSSFVNRFNCDDHEFVLRAAFYHGLSLYRIEIACRAVIAGLELSEMTKSGLGFREQQREIRRNTIGGEFDNRAESG